MINALKAVDAFVGRHRRYFNAVSAFFVGYLVFNILIHFVNH